MTKKERTGKQRLHADKSAKQRIVGYDLARALAVIGMVIVNFKVVMNAGTDAPVWLSSLVGLLEGRAAATFVILSGVGISLLSRRAIAENNVEKLRKNRHTLLKRALFLFIAGLCYTPLWPADILHFYGVYIAICAFFLSFSDSALWSLSFGFMALFVLMSVLLDYEQGWNWETMDYEGLWTIDGLMRHIFFNGFHPVFPWTAFMLVGLWLGRQNLTDHKFRNRLLLLSFACLIVAESLSKYIIFTFGGPALSLKHELVEFFFGTGPIPPMPLYLFSAGSTALALITLCVSLAEKFSEAFWLQPLIATGQLALTNYVAHVIIGMGALEMLGLLNEQSLAFAVGSAIFFCAVTIFFSHFWLKHFAQGPLEWAMRKITS